MSTTQYGAADRKRAIQAIGDAIEAGRKGKAITIGQAAAAKIRLRVAKPSQLSNLSQQLLVEHQAAKAGAIDWDGFAKFLKEILPELLKLIEALSKLFG